MKLIALSIISLSLNSFAAQTASKPLSTLTTGDVKPNVMFILDDSGSMAWSHMPDSAYYYQNKVGYANAQCNGVYYNPNTKYAPPKSADGTSSMDNASFTNAWYDGHNLNHAGGPGGTTRYNLSNGFFAYDQEGGNTGNSGKTDTSQASYYWRFKNEAPSIDDCNSEPKGEWVWDKKRAEWVWVLTPPQDWEKILIKTDEEKQNFANWFSYYRTRMLMMKSSAGTAFAKIGDRYRVGFSSINKLKANRYGEGEFLSVANYNATQKAAWYQMLYGASPGGGTPLKSALRAIGEMYSGNKKSIDPMEYSCQQNFTILTTDGYWNAPYRNGDNPDAVNVGDTDGADNIPYPMRDPTKQENNLADVAMYYFKRDIRSDFANNVPGVEAFAGGEKGRQIMRTYTLGLGMDGTLIRSKYPEPLTGAVTWPEVAGDTNTTIDDLWHAAVNGGGQYFSAKDPNAVAESLSKALSDIEAKTASVGAADISDSFMSAKNNFVYQSAFKTIAWTGEVQALTFNLTTNSLDSKPKWSAQELLSKRTPTDRTIYSCAIDACSSFTEFKDTNTDLLKAMANGVAQLKSSNNLSDEQQRSNTAAALINYLRGDTSNEIKSNAAAKNALYRGRSGILGAIIHGGVSYVKVPSKSYTDGGYSSFTSKNADRPAMVYAPANDGMLHAFNADSGEEQWAFVPPTVIPKLWQLADRSLTNEFKYMVDGAPTIADVKIGDSWKTILVAGLRGGGGEYYALDITNPLSPSLLWSFQDKRLGQTYSFPVVGKVAEKWKVLVSSGYDNSDGKGYVFVLDAATGKADKTIATSCTAAEGYCGIAKIGPLFKEKNVDDSLLMAYAGDLAGGLWRFELGDDSKAAIKVAQTGMKIDTKDVAQAISTAPMITESSYMSAGTPSVPMHYITFGTGRYLNQADMTSIDTHSLYGILVDPSATTMDSDFAALRSSSALSPLVLGKTCDKVIKDNLGGSVSLVSGIDVSTLSNVCTSDSDYDYMTLKRVADEKASDKPEDILACINKMKGWRADLSISKERLANDPLPRGADARFFTSIPGGDACTAKGDGRQYMIPLQINKNFFCANPKIEKHLVVGTNKNTTMLEDIKQVPTIVTKDKDSIDAGPGELTQAPSLLIPQLKGRRTSWQEIVR
ncbi:pilus assembly protein [Iodobacter sp.]|uniref:pilus assembly protein n=1 Tax=Iodobacter sp. TaxID=1915058 RepID=UPI0025DC7622|nr:PilC/PilY family type IV pilus protein [Iodobacter sp.]